MVYVSTRLRWPSTRCLRSASVWQLCDARVAPPYSSTPGTAPALANCTPTVPVRHWRAVSIVAAITSVRRRLDVNSYTPSDRSILTVDTQSRLWQTRSFFNCTTSPCRVVLVDWSEGRQIVPRVGVRRRRWKSDPKFCNLHRCSCSAVSLLHGRQMTMCLAVSTLDSRWWLSESRFTSFIHGYHRFRTALTSVGCICIWPIKSC